MNQYLVIIAILLTGCNAKQTKWDDFEIAKVDYHKDNIQRIFVVVSSEKVNDTLFICQVISELTKTYKLNKQTAVSFFLQKKYADYKANLFIDDGHSLPISEYKNWSDSYSGEYEFETNEYKTFPVSSTPEKQHVYSLKNETNI
jgi:hypothetical protein